jgi:hypothetical protein
MTHNIQGENIVQWSLCKFLDGYLVVPFLVVSSQPLPAFLPKHGLSAASLETFLGMIFWRLCAKQDLMMWDLD